MSVNIIKLNRGDSCETSVITDILTPNDIVYFAILYPNQPFEEALILNGYTGEDQNKETGEILIKISPNDTRVLEPGVYYYTVKLQRGGTLETVDDLDNATEVRTLIERTKFIINE